ncbi:hypothetical protein BpHYR1_017441 [Brachionus plicatilis]|uniref:Uncharacterized protein n=1 Tax=Brachionus plicatilis TaxID=10195 RepID=A0A3M7R407_BRAPC|nr:hypothetical protein BpHYR1_017441 [Brachionus plicatilis]
MLVVKKKVKSGVVNLSTQSRTDKKSPKLQITDEIGFLLILIKSAANLIIKLLRKESFIIFNEDLLGKT